MSEIELVEEDGEEVGEEEEYDVDEDEEAACDEDDEEVEPEKERVTVRIPPTIANRKRSSDEIEDPEHSRGGSPPKRPRKEVHRKSAVLEAVHRKRSSEELDDGEQLHDSVGKKKKRARLGEMASAERVGSLSPAIWGTSEVRSVSVELSSSPRSPSRSKSMSLPPSPDRSRSTDDVSEHGEGDVEEDYAAWYNAVKAREIRIGSVSDEEAVDEEVESTARLSEAETDGVARS